MNILVTGGTGYIGSHIVVELLEAGHQVVVLDNLVNSSAAVIPRIEELTGKRVTFCEADIRYPDQLAAVFAQHAIDLVVHTAGLKAVAESTRIPLDYYQVNVTGTLNLCQAMARAGVFSLVFSSSATVYGAEAAVPYTEHTRRGTTANPYGTSKAMVEKVLEDMCQADDRWSVAFMRFFNPIGAHPSGHIGEQPSGVPNNLMPFISQVAAGRRAELSVYGSDYPTEDGTCQRDYLHVVDIAQGHLRVLAVMDQPGVHVFNLGTGKGTSVLELLNCFEQETGVAIAYRLCDRRDGDLPAFWADVNKAEQVLGWTAQKSLADMVRDTWRWQMNNPDGYAAKASPADAPAESVS